jgi:polysaccharide chain length determinant protein (PEP-CTERM system associated)
MHEGSVPGIERLREIASRRWRVAAAVFVLVLAAAAGAVFGLPNLFRATATVVVERTLSAEDQPGELEARLHLIGQEALSRARLNQLIQRFDLYPELRGRVSEDALLGRMRHDIDVHLEEAQDPGGHGVTTSFTVSYRGRQRTVVADVTNALADFYVREDGRMRTGSTATLQAQLDEVKRRLEGQERRLGDLRPRHGGDAIQPGDMLASLDRISSQLQSLGDSRLRAMERRSLLQKQLAEADPGTGSGDPDAVTARLNKLRQDLVEMRRKYTDKYPDVERLKGEIATLERQAADAAAHPSAPPQNTAAARNLGQVKEALAETEQEIQSLRTEENALRRELEERRARIGAAVGNQAANQAASQASAQTSQELARDYETNKTLYAGLLKRMEEARLNASGDGTGNSRFRVLEPAATPADPVAPNRLRLLLGVLVAAAGAGLAAVVLAEQADTSFHSVDDVRSFTRVPVLVSIPTIAAAEDAVRRRRRRRLAAAAVIVVAGLLSQATFAMTRGTEQAVLALARRAL